MVTSVTGLRSSVPVLVFTILVLPIGGAGQRQTTAPNGGMTEKGHKLLQRAQAAVGGVRRIAAVKDIVEVWQMDTATPGGMMKARQETRWVAPRYFRQILESPMGTMEMYYDGSAGWYSTPDGVTAVPPPAATQVREVVFRIPYTLLLSDRIAGRTITALDDNSVEISDNSGQSVRVELEPATDLPNRFQFRAAAITGEPALTTQTFLDFHPVQDLMVPGRMVMEQNGKKIADVRITETRINSGLTIAGLAKRP